MAKSSFDALVQVLLVLQELEIPYVLVGSFSSNFYSYPRATKDADLVFQYSDGDLQRIRECLDDDFVVDMQMSFEMITGTVRNVLTYKPTKFDIELFRLGDDEHHQERFLRRKSVTVPELQIDAVLPSAEDVLIQKLRWHREKDMDDARKVLQIQFAKLDWKYLRHWTDLHGTSDLLDQLRLETEN